MNAESIPYSLIRSVCFLSVKHPFDDNRILEKEARSLVEFGFEVVHLTFAHDEKRFMSKGVVVCLLKQTGNIFQTIRILYNKAIEIDADCYHCNEVASWIVGCMIKLRQGKKKVIFDVHEHYPSRFSEPHVRLKLGRFGGILIKALFGILVPFTDYFIFAKRSVAPDFSNAKDRQTCIFNYAAIKQSDRCVEKIPSYVKDEIQGPTAIHIGSISKARGWPQLLKALSIMKTKELKVLCLGSVDEGEETLMAEARRLGVADRITLKSHLPYEKMYDYLLGSDIGVMLYQPKIQNHVFAFPIKMYDYMAAGLPLIAPNFAVEVEPVVREEKCGVLIDTGRPEEIADALDWLCTHKEESKRMGARGRRAVVERYNWDTEKQKLIDIYLKLGGKKGSEE